MEHQQELVASGSTSEVPNDPGYVQEVSVLPQLSQYIHSYIIVFVVWNMECGRIAWCSFVHLFHFPEFACRVCIIINMSTFVHIHLPFWAGCVIWKARKSLSFFVRTEIEETDKDRKSKNYNRKKTRIVSFCTHFSRRYIGASGKKLILLHIRIESQHDVQCEQQVQWAHECLLRPSRDFATGQRSYNFQRDYFSVYFNCFSLSAVSAYYIEVVEHTHTHHLTSSTASRFTRA